MYNFTELKNELKRTEEWLGKEYLSLQTGRATPAILDRVQVEQYGSKQPIAHTASITVEDARTIMVSPWDKSLIKEIERAIQIADLGLSVSAVDTGVRVSFPELTGERRTALVKLVKAKLEDARVAVRKERERVWDEIQSRERVGEMSEDEKFRGKDELQKIVDGTNRNLEVLAERKERDIVG